MRYEWDSRKAAQSLRKHGVDFADAVAVLDQDHALTFEDTTAEGETRLVSLAADPFDVLVVIAFTYLLHKKSARIDVSS